MTSISTTSLQQFSCLLNRTSSNSISDEYKKNLYLARIAREVGRESTQNYVESVAETTEEEQNVSNISDEVTISQSTEYSPSKPSENTTYSKTDSAENNQTYDNTINQLKARKNSLQQELNRLHQGTNQAASSNQEGEKETAQDVESPANGMTAEESPLASVLKRQIDEIEQELNKNSTISAISENVDSTNGLNLSQIRQKKSRLEQQLKNMEGKVANQSASVQNNNRTTIGETLEKQGDSPYQNHMEELRIKQEIRNLESEINVLERKKIISKTQAALNEVKNVSNEATTTENHLLNIEI